MGKDEKGNTIRVTLQQAAMLILVAAGSTGGYKLFEGKPTAAEDTAWARLEQAIQTHCTQQEKDNANQNQRDRDQEGNLSMQTAGITAVQTDLSVIKDRVETLRTSLKEAQAELTVVHQNQKVVLSQLAILVNRIETGRSTIPVPQP